MKTKRSTISRRGLLTTGAVAAVGSAALAGTSSLFGQGPAVITARRFRGWVTRGGGTNRTTLQDASSRQWPSAGGPHGSDEPLLLQRRCSHRSAGECRRSRSGSGRRRSRPGPWTAAPCGRSRRPGRRSSRTWWRGWASPHSGARRCRNRGGRRAGSAARSRRRSCLRVGNSTVWLLLSVSSWTGRHVPVPDVSNRPVPGCRYERWHAGICQFADRRTRRIDGD